MQSHSKRQSVRELEDFKETMERHRGSLVRAIDAAWISCKESPLPHYEKARLCPFSCWPNHCIIEEIRQEYKLDILEDLKKNKEMVKHG